MNFLFIFLVFVEVVSPAEMKTMEELEKELNQLKMKLENNEVKVQKIEAKTEDIEAKTEKIQVETKKIKANMKEFKNGNNTEDRLSYLEEMIKLNVIRSCQEMLDFGINTSNYYHVDPDGPLTGSSPFRVWCDFTEDGRAITEVLHNSEEAMKVEKCETPGCYKHNIVYTAPHDQMQALIQLSENCEQTIRYDCLLAPLNDDNLNYGYWNDKQGDPQYYWDGSHNGEHVCSCFYQEEGCFEQNVKNVRCNCDAGVPEMKMDFGTITNKTALPITSLQFGGLVYDIQEAFHTLGRLKCWGRTAYKDGSSCVAIKRSGQFHSGFYNVRENEADNTDLVFCNMTASSGYGEDGGGQTFIESSEAHFEKVARDIAKIEEDIGNIKDEVAMHSSFCGYRSSWTADSTTITYDKIMLEDNNIPGASFDISSGRYTAGTKGTYQADFSIGYMYSYSSDSQYCDMHIYHNGAVITESRIFSYLRTTARDSSAESGGRSMMIQMNQGDYISVYADQIYQLNDVTFCVNLISTST